MKSKRAKAVEFSAKTRKIIKERDGYQCICCGSSSMLSIAHMIPRSKGGLGIEQNGALLCAECHFIADQGRDYGERYRINQALRNHLQELYPDFKDQDRVYRKYEFYRKGGDDESIYSEQEGNPCEQIFLECSGHHDFV